MNISLRYSRVTDWGNYRLGKKLLNHFKQPEINFIYSKETLEQREKNSLTHLLILIKCPV